MGEVRSFLQLQVNTKVQNILPESSIKKKGIITAEQTQNLTKLFQLKKMETMFKLKSK